MLKHDARKFEEKAIVGYFLGYEIPKKRAFNLSSRRVKEWYHVDYQRYTTLPASKGPKEYDSLFDTFTPLLDIQNEDLVHAYLEHDLLYSSISSNLSSASVHV